MRTERRVGRYTKYETVELKRMFDDYAYLVMMACIIILVFTMTNPPSVGLNVLIVTIPVFS